MEPGFQIPAHYPVHRELSIKTHSLPSPHTAVKNGDLNGQLWRHGLPSLLQNFQSYTGTAPESHGIPGTPVCLGSFQRILDTSHEAELCSQLFCKSRTILKDFQTEKTGEDEGFGRQILKAIKIIDCIKTRTISLFDFSIIILLMYVDSSAWGV